MIFRETALNGCIVIELDRRTDERGFFARSFCREEFGNHGLNPNVSQCNVSFNFRAGTLRGLHYQAVPHAEAKLIRCTRGAIFDVVVDLREDSPTFTKHFAITLSADSRTMLYVPEGFAHGFQTLEDETEVFYQMSHAYFPEAARGVRWNDSAFKIKWPRPNPIMNDRDRTYPDFVVGSRTV
jgi:dTDP-4-dehydrorhamnose 3,5-epimerase